MSNLFSKTTTRVAIIALGITFGVVNPLFIPTLVSAQQPPSTTTPSGTAASSFSDVTQDYWASPFIQALAQRGVIAGFPDGTFKPQQAVTRAEFAAMIQKAFNQNAQRQLPAGGFSDVPASYWAANAIARAYETGFMSGYPGNQFRPNQQIPKVEAIVALTSGLGVTTTNTNSISYYADASSIPSYAVDRVAAATQVNLVVNYPDVRVLNPQSALTRAEAAAHLYQALVRQGQLQPLPSNVAAATYIVGGTGTTAQTGGDIVSLAASSDSFTTLTSLLKTAGLAESLQQSGPFTVFAPTNEAFAALPPATLERLQQPENREALVKVLTYHVVPGQLTATDLRAGELNTAEGRPVNVQIDGASNQIRLNNAQVIQPNIQASNGVIHAINQVLIPPNLSLDQQPQAQTNDVDPGRATRGGRSYVGVAGNIGIGGDTGLGEGSFAVISKIGLTNILSVRPAALFADDTIFLVPITLDFAQRSTEAAGRSFSISPYLGAGVAIETSDDADVGLLLTGGVDVPIASRFTITGAVNAAFMDDTDVGILLGVGYNF
jgi:uncharacterized surface protein with fasciclin (FAS1) repeats